MYQITPYTFQRAREIGVEVRPSTNPNKKIDVYKDGKKIASIGDPNYLDFPTYTKEKGQAYANERRRLYHIRHAKDKNIEGVLSKALLW
jgi:hypothetical protein